MRRAARVLDLNVVEHELLLELGDGVGLHWVEAPALTTGDITLVEWVTFFERVVNATIAGEACNERQGRLCEVESFSGLYSNVYDTATAIDGKLDAATFPKYFKSLVEFLSLIHI